MAKKQKLTKEERRIQREQEILDVWPEMRKSGKWKYIFRHGTLGWGITTYLLYMLIMWGFQLLGIPFATLDTTMIITLFVMALVIGTGVGSTNWRNNEKILRAKNPYLKDVK